MNAEKCYACGNYAEPPFKGTVRWNAPETVEDVPMFLRGDECDVVRIERPLCRYCAHALSHGADGLTEEGKDALDLSDED